MTQRIGLSAIGIEEVEGRITIGFSQEFTTGVHISVFDSIHRLAGADTIGVISVADTGGSIRSRGKLSAIFPSECPASAIVITQGGDISLDIGMES